MWRLVTVSVVALALVAGDAGAAGYTITTVAGTGNSGGDGDGGPATRATLNGPQALALLGDGSLLIGERGGNRIRKVSPAGTISLVTTTGSQPTGLAIAPDGESFYFAETAGNRVRRVDGDGTVTTVAGTGGGSLSGVPGTAGSATFSPYGLGVATNGDLLISLYVGQRILKISAGSNQIADAGDPISLAAGTGAANNSGEGVNALAGGVAGPTGIWTEADGSYLFASFDGHVVRRVDSADNISTFAGAGACGGATLLCGDGLPAAEANFRQPWFIVGDGSGGYLLSEYGTRRVRRIDAGGLTSTFAGTGSGCTPATALCGDGGPPANAGLVDPRGVARDPGSGVIYVADYGANRVRAIVPNATVPGPQGPQGPSGGGGPQGPSGSDGADGADGAAGTDGAAGADGGTGPDGRDGTAGRGGRDGADGADGAPGADGAAGQHLPLLAVLPASRVSRSRASSISLSAFVTGPAQVRVTVARRGRRVRSISRNVAHVGRTKLGLGRLRAGRYRVTLTATRDADVFSDRCELIVR